jgi:hypothetical protein
MLQPGRSRRTFALATAALLLLANKQLLSSAGANVLQKIS